RKDDRESPRASPAGPARLSLDRGTCANPLQDNAGPASAAGPALCQALRVTLLAVGRTVDHEADRAIAQPRRAGEQVGVDVHDLAGEAGEWRCVADRGVVAAAEDASRDVHLIEDLVQVVWLEFQDVDVEAHARDQIPARV